MADYDVEWQNKSDIRGRILDPYVSINNNRVRLNGSAAEELGKDVDDVLVGIDETNRLLLLKPANGDEKDSVSFAKGKRDKARQINSNKLTNTLMNLVDDEDGGKYAAEWDDEHGFLVVDLKESL